VLRRIGLPIRRILGKQRRCRAAQIQNGNCSDQTDIPRHQRPSCKKVPLGSGTFDSAKDKGCKQERNAK
jgi:hypothetical protein